MSLALHDYRVYFYCQIMLQKRIYATWSGHRVATGFQKSTDRSVYKAPKSGSWGYEKSLVSTDMLVQLKKILMWNRTVIT